MTLFLKTTKATVGRGFVALLTIIIVSALILAIGLAAAFTAQTQIIISGHIDHEQSVRQKLSSCVDEALYRLKLDAAYVGGTITLSGGSCTVSVSGSGATRTVAATAVEGDYSQSVAVGALQKQNSSGKAKGWSISSWSESVP